jgi:FSR family fosmidomycin resistance protein-like MFS transporter
LVVASLGHFINDGSTAVFPVIYPILISSFSFTTATTGILAGVLYASSLIASPFIGRRSDFNRNYFGLMSFGLVAVASGVVGFGVCLALVHSANLDFWILILFTVVSGFGSAFYHPIGAAILNVIWRRSTRGRAMGVSGSLGAIGILTFPIVADFLIFSLGEIWLALLGLVAILIAIGLYFGIRNIKFKDEVITVNEGSVSQPSPQPQQRHSVPFKTVFSAVYVLMIIAFLRSFFTSGVTQFAPTYLNQVNHVPQAYLGYAIASISLPGIVSQPIFGHFGDRMGRRLAIGVTTIGSAVSIILFLFSTNLIEAELLLAAFGFFQYTSFPIFLSLSGEIAPEGATTLSNSIVWGIGTTGGGSLGPVVIGILSTKLFLGSLSQAFLVVSLIGLTSVALLPFVKRKEKVVRRVV